MYAGSKLDIKLLETNKEAVARNYWKNRLMNLEFNDYFNNYCKDAPKPVKNNAYAVYTFQAPQGIYVALGTLAASDKAKHIVLLATLGLFIQNCSAVSDVIVFNPVYSDMISSKEDNDIIPVRIDELAGSTFRKQLVSLKENLISDFNNSNYPVENILNLSREALRQLFIVGMLVEEVQKATGFDALIPDILFSFSIKDQLLISIRYDTEKFEPVRIEQMAEDYFNVLYRLIINREKELSGIEMLSEKEKERITGEFNDTEAYYPNDKTIIDLFEEQALRVPGNIAVRYGDETISYKELKEKSDRIASYLQKEKGVKTGDLVGVLLERDEVLPACIFGVLKAGGAYVPIDLGYPAARIDSIVEDSGMKVLVTRSRYAIPAMKNIEILADLDTCMKEINLGTEGFCDTNIRGHDLAYVIYTSGSTGKPKGVMIEHHSVINRIQWMQKVYPIQEDDVILQKTPVVFDVSVWELFWWAFAGASLCLLRPGGEKDPEEIIKVIEHAKVTTIHFVPSMLSLFLLKLEEVSGDYDMNCLRQVFSSGEALKPEQVRMFGKTLNKRYGTKLINLYGPTEATVDVSYYECDFEHESLIVPIGKPIDNTRLYILNKTNRIVPIGVPGELYIAGAGLARGYLSNKEMTQEKFIDNSSIGGERIYRTGDKAKWLPDGNIAYLGRSDQQVKLRGFRIELGEIEARLSAYDTIKDCAVIARENNGDLYLVACYVSENEIDALALKDFLAGVLPEYMIPSYYVHLRSMPLSQNGKSDRKALQNVEIKKAKDYVGPSGETEEKLVGIWAEVLGIDECVISINKSFFELGGNSLKLIRLNSIVNKELNIKTSVTEMLRYTTISSFVAFMNDEDYNPGRFKAEAKEEVAGMQTAIDILNINF